MEVSNLAAVTAMASAILRDAEFDLGRFEPVGAAVRGPTIPRSSNGPLGGTDGPSLPGLIRVSIGDGGDGDDGGDGGGSSRGGWSSSSASRFSMGTAVLAQR